MAIKKKYRVAGGCAICMTCIYQCPMKAISLIEDVSAVIDETKCIGCGRCAEGCFAGAMVLCGKEMTPKEIANEVLRDKAYYGNDGGVTFSGGEPFAQKEAL